uniref:Tetraspanin n=1 Tax=Strigamia maritima TaxID=126957 RepID=T1JM01_STRMM
MVGSFLIGFIAWILATSVTLGKFLSGNLLFTYVIIGIGFYLFFIGILGFAGVISQSRCLVVLYMLVAVLCIASQIGGILTLVILRIEMEDVIQFGWTEVNPASRNLIQENLDCCGYEGPREFAYRNDVIDTSCYLIPPRTTIGTPYDNINVTFVVAKRNVTRDLTGLRLKQILSIVASVYVVSHLTKRIRRLKMEKRSQLHAF